MHSSRMRTGRALTVSGGGGVGASQKIFLGGKNIEKKRKKNLEDPPQNLEDPPKLETPEKLETTPPPRKFGDTPWDQTTHTPCEQNS